VVDFDYAKAAKITRMLSSDKPGEVANAAHALIKMFGDVHALAHRIEHGSRSEAHGRLRERATEGAFREGWTKATSQFAKRVCQSCGTAFAGKATAKFCSTGCRVRAHRERTR
jgi:hypothetical protein